MHHLSDDRPRPDDGHFHDDVVKASRPKPRQRRHLRAGLDLEDADRVRFLQHAIHRGVVGGKVREIESIHLAIRIDQLQCILKYGHHAGAPIDQTLTISSAQ
jgi:hypothetical protein